MPMKVLATKFKKHKCLAVNACPVGAITQKDDNTPPVIDLNKCIECETCTTSCPNGEFVRED
jgi:Fe-S-cluster-containing hydrogenase component 2